MVLRLLLCFLFWYPCRNTNILYGLLVDYPFLGEDNSLANFTRLLRTTVNYRLFPHNEYKGNERVTVEECARMCLEVSNTGWPRKNATPTITNFKKSWNKSH